MMKGICTCLIVLLGFAFSTPLLAENDTAVRNGLSFEQQRKFDYFFLEAIRMKESNKHTEAFNLFRKALSIDPTSSTALFEISNYYLFLQQDSVAIDLLRKAVANSENNFDFKLALATVARQTGRLDEAINIYKDLVKENTDKPELDYYLSDLYARKGDLDHAIKSLDALENNLGMKEEISLQKFRMYASIDQKEKAFQEIEKLAAKYPSESKYQILLGDLYLDQNNPDKALTCYRKAHEIDPENPYYIVSMANYYTHKEDHASATREIDMALRNSKLDIDTKIQILGRYIQTMVLNQKDMEDANALFETLMEQHPQEKELNMMYGQFLLSQNKTDEARFQFQVVTESTPENRQAWTQLLAIALRAQDLDACIQVCNDALVHFQDGTEFYFYKGAAYFQKKEYQKALDAFEEGLEIIPEDDLPLLSDFYGQIGDLNHYLGRIEEAYEAYEESLKYNENNIAVLNNYAYFLTLEKKDLDKAERMAAKCVKLQPKNSTYLDTYSWVFFTKGNYTMAKIYIENAILYDNNISAEILDHYGDILFKQGDINKAVEQWTKALELKSQEAVEGTDDAKTIHLLKKKIADRTYYERL